MVYMEYFDEVPEKNLPWLLLKLRGGGALLESVLAIFQK